MSNQYSYNNYVISRLRPEKKEDEKDVVVIGAGIAGLTAAYGPCSCRKIRAPTLNELPR